MADARRVTAIILAAGLSKRLGRNKLLLPLGDETVLHKTAKAALASAVSEVILVTGHEEAEVKQAVEGLSVHTTHNPRYAEGQSTSMIAGIEAAPEDAEAYLFVLGDQPLLTPGIVNGLIALYEESRPDALVAAPTFQGQAREPGAVRSLPQGRTAPGERGCGRQKHHQEAGNGISGANRISPPAQ